MNQTNFMPFLTRCNSSGSTSDKEQGFSINEISRTYVDENIDKNGYAWYRVRVFLNNGSSHIITPYMFNSETAFFIADQLFKWVRVIRVTL